MTEGAQGSHTTFQRERIVDAWMDASVFMLENGEETGLFGRDGFRPDFHTYRTLDEHGIIRLFTARQKGELVGYSIFTISQHIHYPEKKIAVQDVVYVRKTMRGITAVKFLKYCDQEIKSDGANAILRQVSVRRDFTKTLRSMGYVPVETTMMRSL